MWEWPTSPKYNQRQPMLRFFRQLRHRLLTHHKISKYLLYAIGEIVLVVIGILIALQVNNWNEDKKERRQEATYLTRLLEDFQRDSLSLAGSIRLTGFKVGQAEDLLGQFQESSKIQDSVRFVYDAFLVGRGGSFRPYIPSYQKLIVSGNINTVQNDSITAMIARYLDRIDGFESFVYEEGSYRRRRYNEHLHRYFSARIMPEIWNTELDSLMPLEKVRELGIDIDGFKNDPASVYHIQNVSALNAELNHLYNQSMDRYIEPILSMLRKEIATVEKNR